MTFMKSVLFSFALLAAAPSVGPNAWSGEYDNLTATEKAAIGRGELVTRLQEVPGYKWPKVTVYSRVRATPEESAAVMMDYEIQTGYVPDIILSKISKRVSNATVWVDYKLNLPWPLSNESYTVEDTMSSYDDGASYMLAWKLIRADNTKDVTGHAKMEVLGTETFLTYYNFVVPDSGLAGLARNSAIKQVQGVTRSFVGQIEKEHNEQGALLQRQLQALHAALGK